MELFSIRIRRTFQLVSTDSILLPFRPTGHSLTKLSVSYALNFKFDFHFLSLPSEGFPRPAEFDFTCGPQGGQKGNKARRKRIVPWTVSFVLNKY